MTRLTRGKEVFNGCTLHEQAASRSPHAARARAPVDGILKAADSLDLRGEDLEDGIETGQFQHLAHAV